MKRGWMLATAVVLTTNAVAMAPVWRERSNNPRYVGAHACAAQVSGGYGERDRLRLMIHADSYEGQLAGLDAAGLAALGFEARDIAQLGDTATSFRRLASARSAWVRIQQRADSGRRWHAIVAGPTRESVEGEGLVVRGRIGFGYAPRDSMGHTLQRVGQLFSTVPTALYLTAAQADRLREIRSSDVNCAAGLPVTLGNGRDGSVWVESIP